MQTPSQVLAPEPCCTSRGREAKPPLSLQPERRSPGGAAPAPPATPQPCERVLNAEPELPPPSGPTPEKSLREEHFAGARMCCRWCCEPSPAPAGLCCGMLAPSAPQQLPSSWALCSWGLKGEPQLVRDDVMTLSYYPQTGFFKQEFREDLAPTPCFCLLPSHGVPESPGPMFISMGCVS